MRWPFNGALTNLSKQPVYPLISSSEEDHYEKLNPGQSTPDAPGHSKDVDGVWVHRDKGWFFYPNFVKLNSNRLIVKCDGVYDEQNNRITPWDPKNPLKNSKASPANRGRAVSKIPPNQNTKYPDATNREPVKEGRDTHGRDFLDGAKNTILNGTERAIDYIKDAGKTLTNPRSWRDFKF